MIRLLGNAIKYQTSYKKGGRAIVASKTIYFSKLSKEYGLTLDDFKRWFEDLILVCKGKEAKNLYPLPYPYIIKNKVDYVAELLQLISMRPEVLPLFIKYNITPRRHPIEKLVEIYKSLIKVT